MIQETERKSSLARVARAVVPALFFFAVGWFVSDWYGSLGVGTWNNKTHAIASGGGSSSDAVVTEHGGSHALEFHIAWELNASEMENVRGLIEQSNGPDWAGLAEEIARYGGNLDDLSEVTEAISRGKPGLWEVRAYHDSNRKKPSCWFELSARTEIKTSFKAIEEFVRHGGGLDDDAKSHLVSICENIPGSFTILKIGK